MDERRINSIDVMRLLCAVLVVAIHTQAIIWFPELQNGNIQILTRIAVPFSSAQVAIFCKRSTVRMEVQPL